MSGKLQTIVQRDFSGGVNAVSSPFVLGEKQVQRCRNLILNEQGAMTTRDGYVTLTTSPNVIDPILYRGVLNRTNLVSTPFAVQGAAGGASNVLYNTSTSPWTLVFTFSTPYIVPQSVTILNQEVIANGYETPRIFDGTTVTPISSQAGQTTPPGAKHIAFHLGSLWLWNTNPTTTSLDGPSSIRQAAANATNDWPNSNQTFISKDDGQVGMGLATFTLAETGISPTQTLVAFKNYSAYQITGVFGATNFSIQRVKSDMGCISPRTIQFVSGFGLIRLTHKGFALFNGVDDKLISEEVRPFIFGHDDIPGIGFASIERAWAVQSQNPPLYIAACPTSGTQLDRIFVYDLVRQAWTICDYPVSFSCLSLFSTPTTQPVIHAGTNTGGKIVRLFAGDTLDDGVPVPWSFRTREFYNGDFMTNSYWRRLLLDVQIAPPQAVTLTSTVLGRTDSPSAVVSLASTKTGTPWGRGTWGQSVWAASSLTEARGNLDILRVGPAIHFDISGSGHVVTRGLQIQTRTRPVTKPIQT